MIRINAATKISLPPAYVFSWCVPYVEKINKSQFWRVHFLSNGMTTLLTANVWNCIQYITAITLKRIHAMMNGF